MKSGLKNVSYIECMGGDCATFGQKVIIATNQGL